MPTIALGAQTPSTANATSYPSDPFTPAVGDLLFVFVTGAALDPAVALGALTDSQGLGFTLMASFMWGGTSAAYLFRANALAAAVAMTVTFDSSPTTAAGANLTIVRVAAGGAKGQKQYAGRVGAGASAPNVILGAAIDPTSAVFGIVAALANPPAVTAPAGWTASAEIGYITPSRGHSFTARDSGETLTTITWGSLSATAWGAVVVEVGAPAALAVSLAIDVARSAALDVPKPLAVTLGIDVARTAALLVPKPLAATLGIDVTRTAALTVPKPLAATFGIAIARTADLTGSAIVAILRMVARVAIYPARAAVVRLFPRRSARPDVTPAREADVRITPNE